MSKRAKAPQTGPGFWKRLGPGIITGASDDDPSGIATYTQAGARFGYGFLWVALLSFPLMVSVQEMCARIGLVTRKGLTRVIREHYSASLHWIVLLISVPAIVFNIGANLSAMGAVTHLMLPALHPLLSVPLVTACIGVAMVFFSYKRIAAVLKWLCVSLFCYVLIPFLSEPDWHTALRSSFLPSVGINLESLLMLTALMGTTISPYLFFWQTSMEVEEHKWMRHARLDNEISLMRGDVNLGMGLSNLIFYFILLAAASTLYKGGAQGIETVAEAASALRPLAGESAYLLFSVGIMGTGFLSIPVLAGTLGYLLAESFGWKEGLNRKFHQARGFYLTISLALLLAMLLPLSGIQPLKALVWSAVLYGLTAPVLIAVLLSICNKPSIMGKHTNGRLANTIGILTLLIMGASAAMSVWLMVH
jgi:NRAMP (natural resistance-associated macrophage protein)-like metal ion transporter